MTIATIFFDLDDTLYPAKSGLWPAIRERINLYIGQLLDIPIDRAEALRQQYFQEYGTAMLGLQARHAIDAQEFLQFVHDLPLRDYIQPTPGLRSVLEAIPARKFIFTNADAGHARRVLNVLDLEGCFDGIIDILAMSPHCKPMPESFTLALELAGETDPRRCLLVDDLPRNTRAAREQGIFTILYGASEPHPDADAVLPDLLLLPHLLDRVFPGLFLASYGIDIDKRLSIFPYWL